MTDQPIDPPIEPGPTLEEHAIEELNKAGLFDSDADYEGMIGAAVLELVTTFAAQGHSGMSAELTLQAFDLVARRQPLSLPTKGPTAIQRGRNRELVKRQLVKAAFLGAGAAVAHALSRDVVLRDE